MAHLHIAEQQATSTGQYPAAIVLSCIDSRAPAEVIMNLGIRDIFNARVAGNIANDGILGSMEFACKVAGSKVVLVRGHTACSAISSRNMPSRSLAQCISSTRQRWTSSPDRQNSARKRVRQIW